MARAGGFWSYVRDDDTAEGGRITQLGHDIAAQYELLSGQPIELFVDQSSLLWGDDWREKIDEALGSIAFFVPVVTPRYFQSAECRRELQRFVARAELLGLNKLILPLVYADISSLHEEDPADEVARLVKKYTWVDWCQLRFCDRHEGSYRRAVAELAERLLTAETSLTAEPAPIAEVAAVGPEADEPPGLVDLIAQAEKALPQWTVTMAELVQLIEVIGDHSRKASDEINKRDAQGAGFAGRLAVLRQFAKTLAGPSERIVELSSDFTSYLYQVDQGFKALIEQAPEEARDNGLARQQVCEFYRIVSELSRSARDGLAGIQSMVDSISEVEPLSRDLRPVLRTLRMGLTAMVEGQAVTDEWLRLVEASPISCDDLT